MQYATHPISSAGLKEIEAATSPSVKARLVVKYNLNLVIAEWCPEPDAKLLIYATYSDTLPVIYDYILQKCGQPVHVTRGSKILKRYVPDWTVQGVNQLMRRVMGRYPLKVLYPLRKTLPPKIQADLTYARALYLDDVYIETRFTAVTLHDIIKCDAVKLCNNRVRNMLSLKIFAVEYQARNIFISQPRPRITINNWHVMFRELTAFTSTRYNAVLTYRDATWDYIGQLLDDDVLQHILLEVNDVDDMAHHFIAKLYPYVQRRLSVNTKLWLLQCLPNCNDVFIINTYLEVVNSVLNVGGEIEHELLLTALAGLNKCHTFIGLYLCTIEFVVQQKVPWDYIDFDISELYMDPYIENLNLSGQLADNVWRLETRRHITHLQSKEEFTVQVHGQVFTGHTCCILPHTHFTLMNARHVFVVCLGLADERMVGGAVVLG